jgi:hypothetical protein
VRRRSGYDRGLDLDGPTRSPTTTSREPAGPTDEMETVSTTKAVSVVAEVKFSEDYS